MRGAHQKHVVDARFQDFGDHPQRGAVLGDHLQPQQLVLVHLTLRERRQIGGADEDHLVAESAHGLAALELVEGNQRAGGVTAQTLDAHRMAGFAEVNRHARAQPLRKIGPDFHAHLAAHTVRFKQFAHSQKFRLAGRERA